MALNPKLKQVLEDLTKKIKENPGKDLETIVTDLTSKHKLSPEDAEELFEEASKKLGGCLKAKKCSSNLSEITHALKKKAATSTFYKTSLDEYVVLTRIDSLDLLESFLQNMGWKSISEFEEEIGVSAQDVVDAHYYADWPERFISAPPDSSKPGIVKPVFILLLDKIIPEEVKGFLSPNGSRAFVKGEDFAKLF